MSNRGAGLILKMVKLTLARIHPVAVESIMTDTSVMLATGPWVTFGAALQLKHLHIGKMAHWKKRTGHKEENI